VKRGSAVCLLRRFGFVEESCGMRGGVDLL
jgi:hypothetical protein